MKKIILSLALFSVCSVNAQYITNGGFESWANQIIFQTPNNWFTFNQFAVGSTPTPVAKVTDAHSGSFAAKISSTIISFGGSNDTIQGGMLYGSFDPIGGGSPGAPFQHRPDSIVGYYKSNFVGGDSSAIVVALQKYDVASSSSIGIGFCNGLITQNTATYKRFSFPIDYDPTTTTMPDTLILAVSVGGQTFNLASTITVDDIQFVYNTVGVEEMVNSSFKFYPNPANDILVIESINEDEITIYNAVGQLIQKVQVAPAIKTSINCSLLEEGIYFFKGMNGVSEKFVLKH
jgi:hypothetical protein